MAFRRIWRFWVCVCTAILMVATALASTTPVGANENEPPVVEFNVDEKEVDFSKSNQVQLFRTTTRGGERPDLTYAFALMDAQSASDDIVVVPYDHGRTSAAVYRWTEPGRYRIRVIATDGRGVPSAADYATLIVKDPVATGSGAQATSSSDSDSGSSSSASSQSESTAAQSSQSQGGQSQSTQSQSTQSQSTSPVSNRKPTVSFSTPSKTVDFSKSNQVQLFRTNVTDEDPASLTYKFTLDTSRSASSNITVVPYHHDRTGAAVYGWVKPGVYRVKATVTDRDGLESQPSYATLTVRSPDSAAGTQGGQTSTNNSSDHGSSGSGSSTNPSATTSEATSQTSEATTNTSPTNRPPTLTFESSATTVDQSDRNTVQLLRTKVDGESVTGLTYRFELIDKPAGATLRLAPYVHANGTRTAAGVSGWSHVGAYKIRGTVTDEAGNTSEAATTTLVVEAVDNTATNVGNRKPSVRFNVSSKTVGLDEANTVQLFTTTVDDESTSTLTYRFLVIERPEGATATVESTAYAGGTRTGAGIYGFDKPGTYRIEGVVSDSSGLQSDPVYTTLIVAGDDDASETRTLKNNDEETITVAFDQPSITLHEGGLSRNMTITVNAECFDSCTEFSYKYHVRRVCLAGLGLCDSGRVKVRPMAGDDIKAVGFDGGVVQAGYETAGQYQVFVTVQDPAGREVAKAQAEVEVVPALSVEFSKESYTVVELDQNQKLLPLEVKGRFKPHELTYTYTFERPSSSVALPQYTDWIATDTVPYTATADGVLVRDVPLSDTAFAGYYRVTATVQEFANPEGPRKTARALLYVTSKSHLDIDSSLLFDDQTDPKVPKVGQLGDELPFELTITNNNSVVVEVASIELSVFSVEDERDDGTGAIRPPCPTDESIAPGQTYRCQSSLEATVDSGLIHAQITVQHDTTEPSEVGQVKQTLRAHFEIEREYSGDIFLTYPETNSIVTIGEASPTNVESTSIARTGTGSFIIRGQISGELADGRLEVMLDDTVYRPKFVVDSSKEPATFWAEFVPTEFKPGRRKLIRVNVVKDGTLVEGTGTYFRLDKAESGDELLFAETADLSDHVNRVFGVPDHPYELTQFMAGEVKVSIRYDIKARGIIERAKKYKEYAGHTGYEFLMVDRDGAGGLASLSRKVIATERVADKLYLTTVPAPKSETYRAHKDATDFVESLYDKSTLAGLVKFSNGQILFDPTTNDPTVEVSVLDTIYGRSPAGTPYPLGYRTKVRIAGETKLKVKGTGNLVKKKLPTRPIRWNAFYTSLTPVFEIKANGEFEATWTYDYEYTVTYGPNGLETDVKYNKHEVKATKAEGSIQAGIAVEWTTGTGTPSFSGPFIKAKAGITAKLTAKAIVPCEGQQFNFDLYPSLRVTAGLIDVSLFDDVEKSEPRLLSGVSDIQELNERPGQVELFSIKGESFVNRSFGQTNDTDCAEEGDPVTEGETAPEEEEPLVPNPSENSSEVGPGAENPTQTTSENPSQLPIFEDPGPEPLPVPCGLDSEGKSWSVYWSNHPFSDDRLRTVYYWADHVFPNDIWNSDYLATKRLVWLARTYWQTEADLSADYDKAYSEWQRMTQSPEFRKAYQTILDQSPSISEEAAEIAAARLIGQPASKPERGVNQWESAFNTCLEQLIDSASTFRRSRNASCLDEALPRLRGALRQNTLFVATGETETPCWISEYQCGDDCRFEIVPSEPRPFESPCAGWGSSTDNWCPDNNDDGPSDSEEEEGPGGTNQSGDENESGEDEEVADEDWTDDRDDEDWSDELPEDCPSGQIWQWSYERCVDEGVWIPSSYLLDVGDGTFITVDCYRWSGFGSPNYATLPGALCVCTTVCSAGGGLVVEDDDETEVNIDPERSGGTVDSNRGGQTLSEASSLARRTDKAKQDPVVVSSGFESYRPPPASSSDRPDQTENGDAQQSQGMWANFIDNIVQLVAKRTATTGSPG